MFAGPAIGHEADAGEAEDHHRPCGGLRDSTYGGVYSYVRERSNEERAIAVVQKTRIERDVLDRQIE